MMTFKNNSFLISNFSSDIVNDQCQIQEYTFFAIYFEIILTIMHIAKIFSIASFGQYKNLKFSKSEN